MPAMNLAKLFASPVSQGYCMTNSYQIFLGLVLTERFDGRPPEIEEVKRGCAFEQQTTDYITRFVNCMASASRPIPIYQFW